MTSEQFSPKLDCREEGDAPQVHRVDYALKARQENQCLLSSRAGISHLEESLLNQLPFALKLT